VGLLVLAAIVVIVLSVIPVVPEIHEVTIYNAEWIVPSIMQMANEPPVPMGEVSARNPEGIWIVVNTSEGQFSSTQDFIIGHAKIGDGCDFGACMLPPNQYHITFHKTLLGAYETFGGMEKVTVTP
jgi:hypothetical protein